MPLAQVLTVTWQPLALNRAASQRCGSDSRAAPVFLRLIPGRLPRRRAREPRAGDGGRALCISSAISSIAAAVNRCGIAAVERPVPSVVPSGFHESGIGRPSAFARLTTFSRTVTRFLPGVRPRARTAASQSLRVGVGWVAHRSQRNDVVDGWRPPGASRCLGVERHR